MLQPVVLREESRLAREAAVRETKPDLKLLWARYALELAQLAEMVERRDDRVSRPAVAA